MSDDSTDEGANRFRDRYTNRRVLKRIADLAPPCAVVEDSGIAAMLQVA
jgi:hypothetical protein